MLSFRSNLKVFDCLEGFAAIIDSQRLRRADTFATMNASSSNMRRSSISV